MAAVLLVIGSLARMVSKHFTSLTLTLPLNPEPNPKSSSEPTCKPEPKPMPIEVHRKSGAIGNYLQLGDAHSTEDRTLTLIEPCDPSPDSIRGRVWLGLTLAQEACCHRPAVYRHSSVAVSS